jgi:hypothetical protein
MDPEVKTVVKTTFGIWGAFVGIAILWSLAGLAAFIYSLVCLGGDKNPSATRGVIGVIVALLLGPLYWLYWWMDKDYCRGVSTTRRASQYSEY